MTIDSVKTALAAVLFFCAAAPALSGECSVDQVTYVQPEAEGFTLSFRPGTEKKGLSDLGATLQTPTQVFKFSLTASNGYSFNYLVPEWTDAPDDTSFRLFTFDSAFNSLEMPFGGAPAPEAILTPELGVWLYYSESGVREYLPPHMWRVKSCN